MKGIDDVLRLDLRDSGNIKKIVTVA